MKNIILFVSLIAFSHISAADPVPTYWDSVKDTIASYGDSTVSLYNKVKNKVMNPTSEEVAGTAMIVTGGAAVATGTGVVLASAAPVAAITAASSTVGGFIGTGIGAAMGAGVGLASAGTASAATIPFAITGGIFGNFLGGTGAYSAPAALGVGTAPVWAVPVAVGGGILALSGGAFLVYKNYNP